MGEQPTKQRPWLDLDVIDCRRHEERCQGRLMSEAQVQDLIRAEHGLRPWSQQ